MIHLLQGQNAEPAKVVPAKASKPKAERIAANEAPLPKVAVMPAAPGAAVGGPASRPVAARREASPPSTGDKFAAQKRGGFERKSRTGREPGFTTVVFNVGRQHLVTPADLVGKIAGVTRLPANVVGAIDIHEEHTNVDVATEHVAQVVAKLAGIRVKSQSLKLAMVPPGTE